jgi:tetratricopeptide (TPR) repeat protein
MKRYEESEESYREALHIWDRVLSPENPERRTSMHNLALLLGAQEKFDEALEVYKAVFDLEEKGPGLDHPDTLISMYHLADMARITQNVKVLEDLRQRVRNRPKLIVTKDDDYWEDILELLEISD